MKNFILVFSLLLLCSFSFSQKKSSVRIHEADSTDIDMKRYNLAMHFGDYEAAKNALYSLMIKYPNATNYLDSLTRLYFMVGAYSQCVLAGNTYLEKDSNNLYILESVAISQNSLSRSKEALVCYERLYRQTKAPFHAYQKAVLQYILKHSDECSATIAGLITDSTTGKQIIQINVDKNNSQQVPLKAAAYNLRGILEKDMNQQEEARTSFKEALKIFPEFSLAKTNLDYISQLMPPQQTSEQETKNAKEAKDNKTDKKK